MIYIRNTSRVIPFKNIATVKLSENENAILTGSSLTVCSSDKVVMTLFLERETELNIIPKAMRLKIKPCERDRNRDVLIANTSLIKISIHMVDDHLDIMYAIVKCKGTVLYEGMITSVEMMSDNPDIYEWGSYSIVDSYSCESTSWYFPKGSVEEDNDGNA